LKSKNITTVLIGASSVEQLSINIRSIDNTQYSQDEIDAIERILT
jgi:L-glyceraldehyde 3-phosphate reductase